MPVSINNTQTTVIDFLALADEGTAIPTPPALGGDYDWDSDLNWAAAGFRASADDFSFNMNNGEVLKVKAPGDIQNQRNIFVNAPGILESVAIKAYEIGARVLDVAANWTKSGQIYTPTDEITAKAAIIQYKGLGWLYMPSVQIVCGTPDGGVATLASQNVTLHLTATDDVPAGYQWIQFEAESAS